MTKRISTTLAACIAQGLRGFSVLTVFVVTGAVFVALTGVANAGAPPEITSQLGQDSGAPLDIAPKLHAREHREAKPQACNKKFKKALIISGGGISPGVALGLIAGARAAGQKPDVILATCGGSIGASIANAYPNPQDAKKFVMSREFHKYLKEYTHVGRTNAAQIGLKLGEAAVNKGDVPDIFDRNVIDVPTSFPRMLPNQTFRSGKDDTRLITVAARANYKPGDVKNPIAGQTLYEQTFFTDKDTAKALKGMPASMKSNFPDSPIHPWTTTRTDASTIQAMRASISDPYLINPGKIGKDYYFGGAMDLYPIETAQKIACETLATTPSVALNGLEDMAVKRGFGFSQTERVAQLKGYKGVRWAQMKGAEDLNMDPDTSGIDFVSKIPDDYNEYAAAIEKQYEFGYQQAMAAYESPQATTRTRARQGVR